MLLFSSVPEQPNEPDVRTPVWMSEALKAADPKTEEVRSIGEQQIFIPLFCLDSGCSAVMQPLT